MPGRCPRRINSTTTTCPRNVPAPPTTPSTSAIPAWPASSTPWASCLAWSRPSSTWPAKKPRCYDVSTACSQSSLSTPGGRRHRGGQPLHEKRPPNRRQDARRQGRRRRDPHGPYPRRPAAVLLRLRFDRRPLGLDRDQTDYSAGQRYVGQADRLVSHRAAGVPRHLLPLAAVGRDRHGRPRPRPAAATCSSGWNCWPPAEGVQQLRRRTAGRLPRTRSNRNRLELLQGVPSRSVGKRRRRVVPAHAGGSGDFCSNYLCPNSPASRAGDDAACDADGRTASRSDLSGGRSRLPDLP